MHRFALVVALGVSFFVAVNRLSAQQQVSPETRAKLDRQFATAHPQPGDFLPDLFLQSLKEKEGKQSLRYATQGEVNLLITASLTCPKTRQHMPALQELKEKYGKRLGITIVYVIEAHPEKDICPYLGVVDVTDANLRDKILLRQPKTMDERMKLVRSFADRYPVDATVLVDTIENLAWRALGRSPNLALLSNDDDKVLFRQGWFDPTKLDEEVARQLKNIVTESQRTDRLNDNFTLDDDSFKAILARLPLKEPTKWEFASWVEESPPDLLRKALRENPKLIDARMYRGRSSISLLEFVIDLKDLEKVKAVCDAGAKVDQNLRGNMPLIAAVDAGSVEILDELLARGADPKLPADYQQKSLLHYAILEGRNKVAERLVEVGLEHDFFTRCGMGLADEVAKELEESPSLGLLFDKTENIPLTYAVAGDRAAVVRLLLERDMVAPVGGKYRKTPMVLAVANDTTEVLDLLLAHGMSPDVVNGEPLFSSMYARKLEHFQHLLDAKADVEVRQRGSTPLHFAVAAKLPIEFGRVLLEHGADIEALTIAHDDPDGCGPPGGYPATNESPLHLAGREMSSQYAALLLAAKAKTNELDTSNLTPLGAAIVATLQAKDEDQAKGLETIKAMVDGGCSVDVVDSKGKSVRDAIASVLRNPMPPPKAKPKTTDQEIFGRNLPPYLIASTRMGPDGLDATKLPPSPLVKEIHQLLSQGAKAK